MRKTTTSVACGAAALGLAVAGATLTAPSAAAAAGGSGQYIGFTNNGWFLVDTCYKWKSSETADSCDYAKPINTDWRVEIPADAEGVRVEVTVAGQIGGGNVSPQITDLKQSHCYELSGYTWGPRIAQKDC
ncbi:hypothetical protein ABZW18_19475 [Streptomyces sp. NPDC004647]|uniref:hypothetical protein n=1 Tax=Streptomyces sp. NPDC004647 TaxID=3154671 RepID=UPI0033A948EE